LKLTTDRHEASRGLFATTELLVVMLMMMMTMRSPSIRLQPGSEGRSGV